MNATTQPAEDASKFLLHLPGRMKIPAIPGFDQHAFEKYFKNAAWLMLGRILSMVVGFIIARYLGPASFGDLSFAIAFTGIFAAVGALGLDSFIIREIINRPGDKNVILGSAFWMRIAANILLIPTAVLIYLWFRSMAVIQDESLALLIAFCGLASLFKSFNIIDSYFQSRVQSKFVVHVQNICLVISAAVKILLIVLKLPVIYFAIALALDALFLAIGLVIIYQRKAFLKVAAWQFDTHQAKTLLKQSWPLILSAVMVSLYMQIAVVMLKTKGSEAVGIYSAAARISEAWFFIPIAIVTSVFPAIIHARKTDLQRYNKRLQNLYDLLIGISLPVALVISMGANTIISVIYTDQYEGAGLMLSIHIWSGIFVFLGSASGQYLLAEGYTVIAFKRTAIGAVVNILLNLWLIPLYSGVGASVAALAAYFAATFSIFLFPQSRAQGIMMLKSLLLISIIQKLKNR
ncbi:MAG TPA: flippase [Daejeonella sp.]|nr:flippase [Daejeonella sp.]